MIKPAPNNCNYYLSFSNNQSLHIFNIDSTTVQISRKASAPDTVAKRRNLPFQMMMNQNSMS